jgi:hypothetical protein
MKIRVKIRVFWILVLVCLCVPLVAQTVVQRARLGHAVEDLDVMDKQLVALDGQEVFVADPKKGGFTKLFDVRSGGADHCTGIAYVPADKTFLVLDPLQRDRFFVFDDKGAALGTRAITYLTGFFPAHIEALTFLGKATPYPNHVAFLTYDNAGHQWIDVVRLDGTVVLHLELPVAIEDTVYGMASNGGNGFHVVAMNNFLYTVDYAGQITAGPVRIDDDFIFEGIVMAGDRLYVRDYYGGKFIAYDASLQRVPAADVRHDFGVGLPNLLSMAWNSDADRFAILTINGTEVPLFTTGWQVVTSLDDARPMFFPRAHGFLRPRGMSWMADEHKLAVTHMQPQRAILIYSPNGELLEQIDLTAIGRPNQIAWIPAADEFYVRTVEMPSTLRVLSRTGVFLRDVDLSALGPSIGSFTHVNGELLVFIGGLLYRTDLAGAVIASYDPAPLQVVNPSICAITTGPLAGKFAVTSARNGEVVVFSLP